MKVHHIIAILAIIIIAAIIFLPKTLATSQVQTKEEIFRDYIYKYLTFLETADNIHLRYEQSLNVNITKPINSKAVIELNKVDGIWETSLYSSNYYGWRAFEINGEDWLCLRVGVNEACAKNILNNKILAPVYLNLKSLALTKQTAEKERIFFEELMKNNALKIKNMEKKEECTAFSVSYSLSDLPASSLQKLGYTTTSIPVLIKNFDLYLCIDEKGVLHEKRLSYEFNGKMNVEELKLTKYEKITSLQTPTQENRALFSKLYEDLKSLLSKLENAKSELELRTIAAEYGIPSICGQVKDQATCSSGYIGSQKSGEVCEYIKEELKDDCYAEAAYVTKDISWCNKANDIEYCLERALGTQGQ